MIVTCEKCHKEYNDFDHWTYCPHEYFPESLTLEEIYLHNDKVNKVPEGTTEKYIKTFLRPTFKWPDEIE